MLDDASAWLDLCCVMNCIWCWNYDSLVPNQYWPQSLQFIVCKKLLSNLTSNWSWSCCHWALLSLSFSSLRWEGLNFNDKAIESQLVIGQLHSISLKKKTIKSSVWNIDSNTPISNWHTLNEFGHQFFYFRQLQPLHAVLWGCFGFAQHPTAETEDWPKNF